MPLLTEQAAIRKVNQFISQGGYGPEYRVYSVRSAQWGWAMYWLPQNASLDIAGSGPYLCHKNGRVKEFNEVAHRNNIDPRNEKAVVEAFVREAEQVVIQ